MSKTTKNVFRIANLDQNRGLWYNPSGEFTGEIHKELSFCRSSAFKMPFDKKLANVWRSATNTATELLAWFNLEELEQLEKENFFVAIYSTSDYKTHKYIDPDTGSAIHHLIFKQDTATLVELVPVEKFRQILAQES